MTPNRAHPQGYATINVSSESEWAAFGRLPKSVRVALADAPFNISAFATWKYYAEHGEAATLAEIADTNRVYLEACAQEREVLPCS